MAYDTSNVFARILRGEIPCTKLYEDDFALAFPDIAPKAPVHVLIIPKGPYTHQMDFAQNATEAELVGFQRALGNVIAQLNMPGGYRVIANALADGGQEVPHFHLHILGGAPLGPMLCEK